MVFDIYNEEQAKQILKFAIENDFEFDVHEGSVYDLFIKNEIIEQLDWVRNEKDTEECEMFIKYDPNEIQEFVVQQVSLDAEDEIVVWDKLADFFYDRVYTALDAFKEIKEKEGDKRNGIRSEE